MNNRAFALDALRGYAIITMVLSATVVGGILPGWMYHAQTPPPENTFNPSILGITWVDLVFPFFLFAMGAAFPFSIGKRYDKGDTTLKLTLEALKRGMLLTFFAIFIQHFYPYVLSSPQDARAWFMSILCFLVLFPMFMQIPIQMPKWAHIAVKVAAYGTAVTMLLTTEYANGHTFDLYFSNIIILLLANMAIFGSIIYIFTMHNKWARIGVLVVLMAITLSAETEGSWAATIYNYTPLPWIYRFDYLKYLFIVIPGSIAGEYLLTWMKGRKQESESPERKEKDIAIVLLIISFMLILLNLWGLYTRSLFFNLVLSVILLATGFYFLSKKQNDNITLWKKLFIAGSWLLIIGLCLESYQGGIKKDPATFSYFFVTSGLAFMALLFFNILCDYFRWIRSTRFLIMSGQNPMIAYVAGDLLLMPIINLTGLSAFLPYFHSNPFTGFLQGVILTAGAILITMLFTRIKWFWRT